MNILLSAYACEPNRGSEPGIGWNWAVEIAERGHKVWVITRKNNKEVIDAADFDREKIQFIYYDLPPLLLKAKKIIGVNLYYMLWQIGIALQYKKYRKKIEFDYIHHITFGVFRNISYLPFFSKSKFIFGPVGGGDTTPYNLRKHFSFKNYSRDLFRDILNWITYLNPIYRIFIAKTHLILCKTKYSANFIPPKHKSKIKIELEIGIDQIESDSNDIKQLDNPTFLFVGRFIYLKGIDFALKAFKKFQEEIPNSKFVLIGKGEEIKNLKQIETDLNINNIEWIEWINQNDLKKYYKTSTVMIFPSLRDSSGNVVLESLANGTPVVCLDLGGPPDIVGSSMNTIIDVKNKTEEQIITDLTNKLFEIISDPIHYQQLSKNALKRAEEFIWKNRVASVYEKLEGNL